MTSEQAAITADEIFALYEGYGAGGICRKDLAVRTYGAVARLAEEQGHDRRKVILAAFRLDIGHICVSASEDQDGEPDEEGSPSFHGSMDRYGILDHEEIMPVSAARRGFHPPDRPWSGSHVEGEVMVGAEGPAIMSSCRRPARRRLNTRVARWREESGAAFEPVSPLRPDHQHAQMG